MSLQLEQHVRADAFRFQLDELAGILGRLRRRLAGDEYGTYLVEVAGGHVEALDAMTWLTAGELVRRGVEVDEAIEHVSARADGLRALLGVRRAA